MADTFAMVFTVTFTATEILLNVSTRREADILTEMIHNQFPWMPLQSWLSNATNRWQVKIDTAHFDGSGLSDYINTMDENGRGPMKFLAFADNVGLIERPGAKGPSPF